MIKALIIDDERLARQEIMNSLAEFPEIEVIGECANAMEGIEKIEALDPDLIFLDIQMPGKDGFQMLEELETVPEVIFVTAYDDHAIKAFEVNALDYLLKPLQEDRLAEAVHKVIDKKKKEKEVFSDQEPLTEKDQVFVKDGEKCWFVHLSEVRLFESEGNYVKVHFEDNRPMILKSLNNLDKRLDERVFFRANRKHIINLNWVANIDNWFNGGLMVELKGGEKIEISRRQAAKLKEKMSL